MMPGVSFIGGKLSVIGGYSWPGSVPLIEQWDEDNSVDGEWVKTNLQLEFPRYVQVNPCQKHSFSNQLTHNITTDCSLIPDFSTRKIQLQNMLCTNIVFCFCFGLQNNVCTHHVLNLYFSCTEFRNECTICRHIVG